MKINDAGSGHFSSVKVGDAEWLPYGFSLFTQRALLQMAFARIENFIRGRKSCDDKFKTLPGHRSFTEIWDDDNVWVSYCRSTTTFGFTNAVGGKEITICQQGYNNGLPVVVGTLVHEMAHVNGADATTHTAESTLPPCFMSSVYDSTIVGNRTILPVYMG